MLILEPALLGLCRPSLAYRATPGAEAVDDSVKALARERLASDAPREQTVEWSGAERTVLNFRETVLLNQDNLSNQCMQDAPKGESPSQERSIDGLQTPADCAFRHVCSLMAGLDSISLQEHPNAICARRNALRRN